MLLLAIISSLLGLLFWLAVALALMGGARMHPGFAFIVIVGAAAVVSGSCALLAKAALGLIGSIGYIAFSFYLRYVITKRPELLPHELADRITESMADILPTTAFGLLLGSIAAPVLVFTFHLLEEIME